jgi:hypothetical protein
VIDDIKRKAKSTKEKTRTTKLIDHDLNDGELFPHLKPKIYKQHFDNGEIQIEVKSKFDGL